MDVNGRGSSSSNSTTTQSEEDQMDLRRGPWTVEEDLTLMNYIANHGEGRWNSLARCAGLKRTGKSCRLRWLNYLRPDVRRGNITLEEQLLILELHSRWGNRWSKIAQHLPGRTDNEIKNYWRTRVQKHAKQLKCDVNSKQFKDTMRYLWMPRLVERIQAASNVVGASSSSTVLPPTAISGDFAGVHLNSTSCIPDNSSTGVSSDSFGTSQVSPLSDLAENYNFPLNCPDNYFQGGQAGYSDTLISPSGYYNPAMDFQATEYQNNNQYISDNLWNVEDNWFLQQHFSNNI